MPYRPLKLAGILFPAMLAAQSGPDLQQIVERLNRLERENSELREEVRALRREAAAAHPREERLEVQERRTEELAQSKVEAAEKFPVTLSGMLLFNAFWNGRYGGDAQYPLTAQAAAGRRYAGGSPRQSIVSLRFDGPAVAGGGKVSGSLDADFFAGSAQSLNHLLRIRTAAVRIDWENISFIAGQDKPIIAPRNPESLAQVALSPLTAAGNLWLWQPQASVERRFGFGENAGLKARVGVFETAEASATTAQEYAAALSRGRPSLEGRFEWWSRWGENARIEIAPGFHASTTRLPGYSLPSRVYSVDWLIRPARYADFTGTYFTGENVAVLGSLRQGIVAVRGDPHPVHANGGWGQLGLHPGERLTINLFAGQQNDRDSDLLPGLVGRNLVTGANGIYRLGANVQAALEASRIRTGYLGLGNRTVNHYDVALAYLF
ncbi:MAG: hypothetical protein ACE15B_06025 [Bryobacteraceae bacterium]